MNSFVTESISDVTEEMEKRTPSKKMTLKIDKVDYDDEKSDIIANSMRANNPENDSVHSFPLLSNQHKVSSDVQSAVV